VCVFVQNDRVAIHEVMEQQTVTIAKAGIHASLNARSSVLAAANPIYGQYDKTRRPQENIGLPDSLLSRFDLLFIVLDQLDPTLDRTLSEHVIRCHQYRRTGTIMEPEPLNSVSSLNLDDHQDASVAVDSAMWQRGNRVLAPNSSAGGDASNVGKGGNSGDLLTKEFLRKYIHYAKSRVQPVLSDAAMEVISASYANMRARQTRKNLPVTARTLETIIRLSSASAKARLSSSVDECDVEVAMELMNFVMFHEIGSDEVIPAAEQQNHALTMNKGKLSSTHHLGGDKENKLNSNNDSAAAVSAASVYDDVDGGFDDDEDDDGSNDEQYRSIEVNSNSPRYRELQSVLDKYMVAGEDIIPVKQLLRKLNYSSPGGGRRLDAFKRKEVVTILYELERQNKVCRVFLLLIYFSLFPSFFYFLFFPAGYVQR
jgi:DNA replicative helicase MCM subunit Mcm2 (Cdc46/Mcm family)